MESKTNLTDTTEPLRWLAACPAYQPTPLNSIEISSAKAPWSTLLLKDETSRMGLGSFKALGGAYAVIVLTAKEIERQTGQQIAPSELGGLRFRQWAEAITFCCASAGNHGLSVATGAKIAGARSQIYLAKTVPEQFADRLRSLGATVVQYGSNYDEAMHQAQLDARNNGWQLLSDSSWTGYTRVPSLVGVGSGYV